MFTRRRRLHATLFRDAAGTQILAARDATRLQKRRPSCPSLAPVCLASACKKHTVLQSCLEHLVRRPMLCACSARRKANQCGGDAAHASLRFCGRWACALFAPAREEPVSRKASAGQRRQRARPVDVPESSSRDCAAAAGSGCC